MSGIRLTLKQAPSLRIDARALNPAALEGLALAQVEHVTVTHGTETLPLAEFFAVAEHGGAGLVIEGDLARFDRIGWQLAGARLEVRGAVGHYAGAGMTGGELVVHGDAGALAGCEMAGGTLTIDGNVGDFAASTQPGSMDGMRGGTFVVRGNAGARCADGMRRGSIVFAGAAPVVPSTFVPAGAEAPVFWQLLARDLARHGGPFAGLASRAIERRLGDLAAAGTGELILVRA